MILSILSPHIFLINNFLSKVECEEFIALSEKIGYEAALVETEKGFERIEGTRNNDRVLFTDHTLAEEFFKKAKAFLPNTIGNSKVCSLNELFRFYRYIPGQKFKKHHDQSFIRNDSEASYYTFMIYLNDDFKGGETKFDDVLVAPSQGSLLVFLHQLEHEGKEIIDGVKYILRTDVMYKLEENQ